MFIMYYVLLYNACTHVMQFKCNTYKNIKNDKRTNLISNTR